MRVAALCLRMSLWMPLSVCSADSSQVEFRTQRHVQLFRRLQAQWQCYDAYACLTFTNSLRWYHLSEIASICFFSVIRCCFRPPLSSAIVTRQTQYKPEKNLKERLGMKSLPFFKQTEASLHVPGNQEFCEPNSCMTERETTTAKPVWLSMFVHVWRSLNSQLSRKSRLLQGYKMLHVLDCR